MSKLQTKVFVNLTNRFVKVNVPHPSGTGELQLSIELPSPTVNSKMSDSQSVKLADYLNDDAVKAVLQASLLEAFSNVEVRDSASSAGGSGNSGIADAFGDDTDTI